MPAKMLHLKRWRTILIVLGLGISTAVILSNNAEAVYQKPQPKTLTAFKASLQFSKSWEKRIELKQGETFDVSVSLPNPSSLPAHGRVAVRWELIENGDKPPMLSTTKPVTRQWNDFGIYTKPTANWRKVLHALDPDVFVTYRAPVTGTYSLNISPVIDETPVFEGVRWREEGSAPNVFKFPQQTPWTTGKAVPLNISINPLDVRDAQQTGMYHRTGTERHA